MILALAVRHRVLVTANSLTGRAVAAGWGLPARLAPVDVPGAVGRFLDAVRPRYVLFATGYRNRFGYPRPETVARYQATGATLLNASDEGALTFRLEPGQPLEPERYRRDHRRYWTAP